MTARNVLSFKNAKGILVKTDDVAPFASNGQIILYSELDDIKDGDRVLCGFKNKSGVAFKQFFLEPATKKKYLLPVSMSDKEKVLLDRKNMKYMYRIVGVVTRYM